MNKEHLAVFASIHALGAGSATRKSPALMELALQGEETDDERCSVPCVLITLCVWICLSSCSLINHVLSSPPSAKAQAPQPGSKQAGQ